MNQFYSQFGVPRQINMKMIISKMHCCRTFSLQEFHGGEFGIYRKFKLIRLGRLDQSKAFRFSAFWLISKCFFNMGEVFGACTTIASLAMNCPGVAVPPGPHRLV